jgi:hypothetical protein
MSKHLRGDTSLLLAIRLRLAARRMITANARQAAAQARYEDLYWQRYETPTLKQQLDSSPNYFGCLACGKEATKWLGKDWCYECDHDKHLTWLNELGERA